MSSLAIEVTNLSKRYRLGQRERYLALRDVLARALMAPFRSHPWSSAPSQSSGFGLRSPVSALQSHFWALHDVSFSIAQGEVVGIVGRNGAGKSTLLKILSRITKPTSGHATLHGRVGSLLEVGTGFHPELTGRENIFLNGAILGMRHVEIQRKFDEIVAFAEVEKFLDTPVKHYSSGMHVRLAFAVAAHLDPEILFVDEVLAVGDAAFQRKCLGKMGAVAKGGRTVVLVSHQLNQLRRLCEHCLWLDEGRLKMSGPTHVVIGAYETATATNGRGTTGRPEARQRGARFLRWEIVEPPTPNPHLLTTLGPVQVKFVVEAYERLRGVSQGIALYNADRQILWGTITHNLELSSGRYEILYDLSGLPLRPGAYQWLLSLNDQHGLVDLWDGVPDLLVATTPLSHSLDDWAGVLNIPCNVTVTSIRSEADGMIDEGHEN